MHTLFLSAALMLAGGAPEPSAMVLTAKGIVKLEPPKTPKGRLQSMDLLFAGDRLVLAEGAEVLLVFLDDGHRERVQGKGEAIVTAKGCNLTESVQRVEGAK